MRARSLLGILHLPLFVRELMVSGNTRRTYEVRLIVLAIMFAIYGTMHLKLLAAAGSNASALLSSGLSIDTVLFGVTAVQVALGSLVQCATCISSEKEGGTLSLLLLTPLGAGRLVLQKWLSRLVDTASLVLLLMPLLAVGYSLGGITSSQVAAASIALVHIMLQFGAIGLFASCCARTSMGALLVALVLCAGWYLLVLAVVGALASANLYAPCFVLLDLTPLGILATTLPHLQMTFFLSDWPWLGMACVLPFLPLLPPIVLATLRIRGWREIEATVPAPRDTDRPPRARRLPQALGLAWLAWRQSYLRRRSVLIPLGLCLALVIYGGWSGGLVEYIDSSRLDEVPFQICLWLAIGVSCGFLAGARMRQTLEVMLTTPCGAEGMVAQVGAFHRRVLWVMLAALALDLLVCGFRTGGIYDGVSSSFSQLTPPWLTTIVIMAVALASMRNALVVILSSGLLVDAGMRWPWAARFGTTFLAGIVLVALPIAMFWLTELALGTVAGPWVERHGEQADQCAWMAAASVSPSVLMTTAVEDFNASYATLVDIGMRHAAIWFQLLMLAAAGAQGLAIGAWERWLRGRAVERLSRTVETVSQS